MTNPAKVTPITPAEEPEVVAKAKSTVKQSITKIRQNPNVKWVGNTVRGVLITGVAATLTQGVTQTVTQGLDKRIPRV